MSYFEARLKTKIYDLQDTKEKLEFCEKLGIRNVIIEPIENLVNLKSSHKEKIKNLSPINIFFRITLKIENLKAFKKVIKNVNHTEDIIAIETSNLSIQTKAANHSKIDLISYSNLKSLNSLSRGVLSLVNQNDKFVEFCLTAISSEIKSFQSKIFRILYKSINLVNEMHTNYILSGGFSKKYDYRNPRALISIANTLVGIRLSHAKRAFGKNIENLIDRSKIKTDRYYYENGVNLLKGRSSNE